MKKIFYLLLIFALLAFLGACSSTTSVPDNNVEKNDSQPQENNQVEVEINETDENKYEQIKTGMSYAEVVELLGEEGTESASTSSAGIEGKYYEWEIDGDIIHIVFVNDKVNTKAHGSIDINFSDKKISLDMYNQIKEGMTYEETIEILGEGEEVTSSEVSGIKTSMYQWVNEDGSNINIMFQDNKVNTKAQFGLK